ncbi:hypothetical protein DEM27_00210 [Metarhizobium album]|uniref:Uncharacterized protein n=1 Tax=Metarhizobium album TaxID=2182425 RepID=A0A2U2DWS8_9HYPH|nr:hypothetical protein [Rhizobium album]PWE57672.1 hypothetical protein DEM27_00210 [Rhizobium album]
MSLPETPDYPETEATLLSEVNGNPYNALTNPKGLAKGGHRQNWNPAMNAVSTVAGWINGVLDFIAAAVDQVAEDAASAAAGSGTESSVADIRAGTSAQYLSIRRVYDAGAPVALTDAASIAWDIEAGINFDVTIGAAGRALANPTGKVANKSGILSVIQGSGGNKTITNWGTDYKWFGPQPSWPTSAGAVTMITYFVRANGEVWLTWGGNKT